MRVNGVGRARLQDGTRLGPRGRGPARRPTFLLRGKKVGKEARPNAPARLRRVPCATQKFRGPAKTRPAGSDSLPVWFPKPPLRSGGGKRGKTVKGDQSKQHQPEQKGGGFMFHLFSVALALSIPPAGAAGFRSSRQIHDLRSTAPAGLDPHRRQRYGSVRCLVRYSGLTGNGCQIFGGCRPGRGNPARGRDLTFPRSAA